MKLSKTQQMALDDAKRQIDKARRYDYPEWLRATDHYFQPEDREQAWKKAVAEGYMKDYWQMHRDGIALLHCNSKTIERLEKLGYIKIIVDGRRWTDKVKVLNY